MIHPIFYSSHFRKKLSCIYRSLFSMRPSDFVYGPTYSQQPLNHRISACVINIYFIGMAPTTCTIAVGCATNCCDITGACPSLVSDCYSNWVTTTTSSVTTLASNMLGIVIGVSVGIVVIIALTIGLCVWRCRRNNLLALKAQAANTTMIIQQPNQMGGMPQQMYNQAPPMPMYNPMTQQPPMNTPMM